MMHRVTVSLLASALVLATACGGGGSDGGVVSGGGGSSTLTASFTPEAANPGSNTVALGQGSLSANLVTLRVGVTDVDDVHHAAFEVVYDGAVVDFVDHSPGVLLEQGGNSPTYQVSEQGGKLVVGISRSGPTGTDANGTRTLVSFTFRVLQAGNTPIAFQNYALMDSGFNAIGVTHWYGGTLAGTDN
jgi:hypothetical protein